VTRPDVMAEFRAACGHPYPCSGDPLAAAAAMAVLDVIEAEGLIAKARRTGAHLQKRLGRLVHPAVASVRGRGLLAEVEIRRNGQPDAATAAGLVAAMQERGVLIGRSGHLLRLSPPMPFARRHAEELAERLAEALAALPD